MIPLSTSCGRTSAVSYRQDANLVPPPNGLMTSRRGMLGLMVASVAGVAVAALPGRPAAAATATVYGAQRAGAFYPTDSNTGVPPEHQAAVAANVVDGDVLISTSGTAENPFIYEKRTVRGRITIVASNVIVRYCRIVGNTSTAYSGPDTGLINCASAGNRNVILSQNTLDAAKASVSINGIRGANYMAVQNRIKNVVDGVDVYLSGDSTSALNVMHRGNYISDLTYLSPDPNHSDNRTHNDCIQIPGNGGVDLLGDRLEARISTTRGSGYDGLRAALVTNPYGLSVTGQCVALTSNVSAIVHPVSISGLWLSHGAQGITWIDGGRGSVTASGHRLVDNVFTRDTNPLITKDGVAARRPILLAPDITVSNVTTVVNPAGVADNTKANGGSNNRWSDNGSFATFTRRAS